MSPLWARWGRGGHGMSILTRFARSDTACRVPTWGWWGVLFFAVAQLEEQKVPQAVAQNIEFVPQSVEQLAEVLFLIPWGHHRRTIERLCSSL